MRGGGSILILRGRGSKTKTKTKTKKRRSFFFSITNVVGQRKNHDIRKSKTRQGKARVARRDKAKEEGFPFVLLVLVFVLVLALAFVLAWPEKEGKGTKAHKYSVLSPFCGQVFVLCINQTKSCLSAAVSSSVCLGLVFVHSLCHVLCCLPVSLSVSSVSSCLNFSPNLPFLSLERN
jgi:hypothetical protein